MDDKERNTNEIVPDIPSEDITQHNKGQIADENQIDNDKNSTKDNSDDLKQEVKVSEDNVQVEKTNEEELSDYDENSDYEDIDDFSDTPSYTNSKPETSEKLTSSNIKEDPTLDEAITITQKKKLKPTEFFTKFRKIILIILGILIAAFLLLYIICIITRPSDTIARNVWIGDLYVGGLSYDDALASIEASDLMGQKTIKLKCNDDYYVFSGADVGSIANAEETAKMAFNYGKSGNFLKDGLTEMRLLLGKHVMDPTAAINTDLLSEVLRRFGTDIYGELVQHSVEFTDTSAIVTPGHTGFDGDVSTALNEVEQSVSKAIFDPIEVTLKSAPPDDFTIETFDNICYKDPVDAYYSINGNSVDIVPEQTGRYINKEEAAALLPLIKEGGEPVTIPIYPAYASITAESLKAKLFANTLGSYSTNYGSSTANRAANVARAASLINGKVLAPGDVFSFNDTVGPRTTQNGFFTAKEYIDGKSVDGIGGGTCQVSTTLYSAVLYADMSIVHRENHMMTIGYAPLGQDATVAYNSVDFKFKNSSDYPVKISATTNGSTITISILGTAWEPAREVKLLHSTSYSGKNTVVTSVRQVYSNGQLIATDNLGKSVYMPHSEE